MYILKINYFAAVCILFFQSQVSDGNSFSLKELSNIEAENILGEITKFIEYDKRRIQHTINSFPLESVEANTYFQKQIKSYKGVLHMLPNTCLIIDDAASLKQQRDNFMATLASHSEEPNTSQDQLFIDEQIRKVYTMLYDNVLLKSSTDGCKLPLKFQRRLESYLRDAINIIETTLNEKKCICSPIEKAFEDVKKINVKSNGGLQYFRSRGREILVLAMTLAKYSERDFDSKFKFRSDVGEILQDCQCKDAEKENIDAGIMLVVNAVIETVDKAANQTAMEALEEQIWSFEEVIRGTVCEDCNAMKPFAEEVRLFVYDAGFKVLIYLINNLISLFRK